MWLCGCGHDVITNPLQCSKLLTDTNVIQFYPSKFVLITDILDNFGECIRTYVHDIVYIM